MATGQGLSECRQGLVADEAHGQVRVAAAFTSRSQVDRSLLKTTLLGGSWYSL